MTIIDRKEMERDGRRFAVLIYADENHGTPWTEEDGHGPVSEWTTRAKRPGERVLSEDRRSKRFYDMAEATRIARRDGWDAKPYGTGTAGQTAARAVEADYQRMRAWCNDEWHYVGVVVRPICGECGEVHGNDYRFALWGIESDAGEYLDEVANELIDEAMAPMTAEG